MARLTDAFTTSVATVQSPLGPLLLGIVDAGAPGVAEGVSRLLMRSIQDAREASGGHLPGWLVDDIERNYISPRQVQTLWAPTGHRFAVIHRESGSEEIIATVHVARRSETILTVDRNRNNVHERDYPHFKPEGHHHVVNLSVKHELRRARIGTLMIDGIIEHFRASFDGEGLWVRADPPWHPGLVGLGFEHDPSMDVFLPEDAVRTANLPHAAFNRRYECSCAPSAPRRPAALAMRPTWMATKKLQYVSFTRSFDQPRSVAVRDQRAPSLEGARPLLERYARDWGRRRHVLPRAVSRPSGVDEVAELLRWASHDKRRVAVRGAGFSADGQASSDDIVLGTERLDRVLSVEEDRIRVEAGISWRALLEALSGGRLFPPVIPGWLAASVGGTLSTGGFSKGSRAGGYVIDHVRSLVVVTGDGRTVACSRTQAGWLFDAVLGGYGHFGVVVEATLDLVERAPFVRVTKTSAGDRELEEALSVDAFHVAAFAGPAGWTVVHAREADEPAPEDERFEDFVMPRQQSDDDAGPRSMVQLVVPLAAVAEVAARGRAMRPDDVMHVHAVRQLRPRPNRLVPEVDGEIAAMMTWIGAPSDDGPLRELAKELGGAPTLLGAMPDETAWLGSGTSVLERAKSMADPANVLGARIRTRDATAERSASDSAHRPGRR